ncbi:MAG: RAD55 family ATPase [Melioribacteraceae bacterium]|nr:RAD55 family ATPase [Melioribacteraceae bacterium]MCF8412168.1 RAD55 family ATPase [Melioribacteraceae bacterium]MCF8432251.1 RAD55 family ATPase [Melioribacteraceae bacterium]
MTSSINLVKTGFNLLDNNWGGVYQGGSYVVIGPHKSGRTLLGLQYAIQSAKSQETCLYFTNMRPKDLMIQAASLNFDIQSYMNKNLLVVVRVAPPSDISDINNHDEFLIEYMNDIVTVVSQYSPNRIIFDELTPYIGFRNLDLLRDVFLHTLETIEDRDITSMFVLGEPATEKAAALIETIAGVVTGRIYLRKAKNRPVTDNVVGTATIIPNIGHTQGKFTKDYEIKPYIGVTAVGEKDDNAPATDKKEEIERIKEELEKEEKKLDETKSDLKKINVEPKKDKPISVQPTAKSVEKAPPKHTAPTTSTGFKFSNIYSFNDFQLILNNQIALFKSTGQVFNLLIFKIDPAALVNGYLTLSQFQQTIKASVDNKDKICLVDNKIIVLVVKSTEERVQNIFDKIKPNLPSKDEDYIKKVIEYISVFNYEIEESISNADKLTEYVIAPEREAENAYISYSELEK